MIEANHVFTVENDGTSAIAQKNEIALFCKSFRRDVLRALRLLDSIERHNVERIPTYFSVPNQDLELFRNTLGGSRCEWVTDEDICLANPAGSLEQLRSMDGRISQQVIKAEFWRLIPCRAYLCLDSDAFFIRDFGRSEFLHPAGHPYTLLHQSREYLQMAVNRRHGMVLDYFLRESATMKEEFGRHGPDYDFGPSPFLWSPEVWRALDERHLQAKGENLWSAILRIPAETRWYGEALLAFRPIPLDPIEPLFRVYHHDWYFFLLRRQGERESELRKQFLGVIYQSNWERSLDRGEFRKPLASRLWKNIKTLRHRFS